MAVGLGAVSAVAAMALVAGFAGGGLAAGVIATAALITGLAVRERGPTTFKAAPPQG